MATRLANVYMTAALLLYVQCQGVKALQLTLNHFKKTYDVYTGSRG